MTGRRESFIFRNMSKYSDPDVDILAAVFKALSNQQRLRIFMKLATKFPGGPCCEDTAESTRRCVGELGADLGLAASTISHHLKELRQAGLVRVERRGQKIECWVGVEVLKVVSKFLNGTCCGCHSSPTVPEKN